MDVIRQDRQQCTGPASVQADGNNFLRSPQKTIIIFTFILASKHYTTLDLSLITTEVPFILKFMIS